MASQPNTESYRKWKIPADKGNYNFMHFYFINKSFKLNVMHFTDQGLEYHYANSLNETKLSVSEQHEMKCVLVPDEMKPIM
jgi:hypothetical protein